MNPSVKDIFKQMINYAVVMSLLVFSAYQSWTLLHSDDVSNMFPFYSTMMCVVFAYGLVWYQKMFNGFIYLLIFITVPIWMPIRIRQRRKAREKFERELREFFVARMRQAFEENQRNNPEQ